MQTRTKVIIGIVVLAVFGSAAALSVVRSRDRGIDVRMEEVARRELEIIVRCNLTIIEATERFIVFRDTGLKIRYLRLNAVCSHRAPTNPIFLA